MKKGARAAGFETAASRASSTSEEALLVEEGSTKEGPSRNQRPASPYAEVVCTLTLSASSGAWAATI
jgi:hypothetical protein